MDLTRYLHEQVTLKLFPKAESQLLIAQGGDGLREVSERIRDQTVAQTAGFLPGRGGLRFMPSSVFLLDPRFALGPRPIAFRAGEGHPIRGDVQRRHLRFGPDWMGL